MITSMIEGGIRIPRFQMRAYRSDRQFGPGTLFHHGGRAIRVSSTTDAPTIPVVAAMTVPINVTDMASPPGIPSSQDLHAS